MNDFIQKQCVKVCQHQPFEQGENKSVGISCLMQVHLLVVSSDQGLHCSQTGFSIKNSIKVTIRARPLKITNGLIQHIIVEESYCIQWVNRSLLNKQAMVYYFVPSDETTAAAAAYSSSDSAAVRLGYTTAATTWYVNSVFVLCSLTVTSLSILLAFVE